MQKIAILEPGAFGTAIGILLSKENAVCFWYKNKELSSYINQNRTNNRLPAIKIPQEIVVSSKLSEISETCTLIINASPSFNFRDTCEFLKGRGKLPPILGLAKGMEKETLKLPSEIVREVLGKVNYAHLSGPGFAKEIANGRKASEVLAVKDPLLLKKLAILFSFKNIEISTSSDLIGVQLAGAMKNALAIAISMVEVKSKNLVVRKKLEKQGLAEMIKVGGVLKAKRETFEGPAGWDDLVLTSTNPLSRNWQFGHRLLYDSHAMRKEIIGRKITVEGFDNIWAFYKLGKIHKLDLPIINEIYKVIYQKYPPITATENLINL